MIKLVLGELKGIFNLRMIKLLLLSCIGVMIINTILPSFSVIILTPVIVYFIVISYGFYNMKENGYEKFLSSLPLSREDIVISKYILGIFSLLIGMLITLILYSPMGLDLGYPIGILDIVFSISASLIILSVLMPINFKNQYRICRVLNPIILVTLLYFGYSAFYGNFIRAIDSRSMYSNIVNYLDSDRNIIIFFGVVSISLFIYFISMKISIDSYKIKDI
ncbi:MAG: ABC-2 transporter permease [Clostridium sp.]